VEYLFEAYCPSTHEVFVCFLFKAIASWVSSLKRTTLGMTVQEHIDVVEYFYF